MHAPKPRQEPRGRRGRLRRLFFRRQGRRPADSVGHERLQREGFRTARWFHQRVAQIPGALGSKTGPRFLSGTRVPGIRRGRPEDRCFRGRTRHRAGGIPCATRNTVRRNRNDDRNRKPRAEQQQQQSQHALRSTGGVRRILASQARHGLLPARSPARRRTVFVGRRVFHARLQSRGIPRRYRIHGTEYCFRYRRVGIHDRAKTPGRERFLRCHHRHVKRTRHLYYPGVFGQGHPVSVGAEGRDDQAKGLGKKIRDAIERKRWDEHQRGPDGGHRAGDWRSRNGGADSRLFDGRPRRRPGTHLETRARKKQGQEGQDIRPGIRKGRGHGFSDRNCHPKRGARGPYIRRIRRRRVTDGTLLQARARKHSDVGHQCAVRLWSGRCGGRVHGVAIFGFGGRIRDRRERENAFFVVHLPRRNPHPQEHRVREFGCRTKGMAGRPRGCAGE
mmetsp:Transcript_18108/g.37141  ORF Transcript_18108/g.37141 Transcript_18108/m.37141 type:complete len:446 (+) Transcript_18108:342-1679(+)